jgi:hypothetical protein
MPKSKVQCALRPRPAFAIDVQSFTLRIGKLFLQLQLSQQSHLTARVTDVNVDNSMTVDRASVDGTV